MTSRDRPDVYVERNDFEMATRVKIRLPGRRRYEFIADENGNPINTVGEFRDDRTAAVHFTKVRAKFRDLFP